ncbi:hypothetical protein Tco_0788192 [Tanacetum coccineum]
MSRVRCRVFLDCKILVELVQNRIGTWKNKYLSFVGRLQLIMYVLFSMHLYWAFVFILLSRIIDDLEQLMRGFLWCGVSMKRGKSKVAWEDVCLPKREDGLGIRRLENFNMALMATCVWDLIKVLAGMQSVAAKLEDIVALIMPIAHNNSIKSIVARLVLAASA